MESIFEKITREAHERDLVQIQTRTAEWAARLTIVNSHLEAFTGYARLALNGLILANGAAAGAVLTFFGTAKAADRAIILEQVATATGSFAFGTLAAIVAALMAYFSEVCFYDSANTDPRAPEHKQSRANGMRCRSVALFCVFAGVAAFIFGAGAGLFALLELPAL